MMRVAQSAARADRRLGTIDDVVGSAVFGAALAGAVTRSGSAPSESTTT